MRYFLQRKLLAQLSCHRSHRFRSNPARNNQVEVTEIDVHVQSEAMRGHAPRNMNSNGSNLGLATSSVKSGLGPGWSGGRIRVCPHSRQSRYTLRGNTKVSAAADQNFFQAAHVLDRAQRLPLAIGGVETTQVEHRITHQLSRTVEGYVAAAITLAHPHAAIGKLFRRGDDVGGFSIAAQSDHRRVLEQQKYIANATFFSQLDQSLL